MALSSNIFWQYLATEWRHLFVMLDAELSSLSFILSLTTYPYRVEIRSPGGARKKVGFSLIMCVSPVHLTASRYGM